MMNNLIGSGTILTYIFAAWCLSRIAAKYNDPNPWVAWIPIFNLFLLARLARRPAWYAVATLIPIAGLFFAIVLLMGLAERCGRHPSYGFLLLIPLVNLIALAQLAFFEPAQVSAALNHAPVPRG
jgi:hypothetical protein